MLTWLVSSSPTEMQAPWDQGLYLFQVSLRTQQQPQIQAEKALRKYLLNEGALT